jgi:DNA-binding SARP family transcriptional activator/streptogramin lyase
MRFRLLGPVELEGEHGTVPLGSAKQRALLAILLLHANEVVSQQRLVDELWGDVPPASAAHGIEAYVSRLRKALQEAGGDGLLTTRGKGYMLAVEAESCDVAQFERLLEEARAVDAEHASSLLREALALWRGPALADVELAAAGSLAVERLEELRLSALEERIEADLALGRHASTVGELQALVAAQPLRERLRAQHMRALYGTGRQAEALESYADARRALRELGLEPSQQLKDLQRRILAQDPSLESRAAPPPPIRRRRRRAPSIVGAVVLLAAGAAALAIALARGSGTASRAVPAVPNSVGLFDPVAGRLVADIPIGGSPSSGESRPNLAVGLGSVWVCNVDDQTLLRIDPRTHAVTRTIGLGVRPAAVTVGHGAVWVVPRPATIVIKLDALGNIIQRLPLSNRRLVPHLPYRGRISVASGPDAIWVLHGLASVAKLDPRTGKVLHDTVGLGGVVPTSVLATGDAVWLTGTEQGLLLQLDPQTGKVAGRTPAVGEYWLDMAKGPGGIWVTDYSQDLVWRIDPVSKRPTGSVAVDHAPSGVAAVGGSVWVVSFLGGTIQRIDPQTLQVASRAEIGPNPSDLAGGPGGLWVAFGGAP